MNRVEAPAVRQPIALLAACALLIVLSFAFAAIAHADSSGNAVAYQIDVAHSGVQSDDALVPPLRQTWRRSFAADASYPLIAGGKVFLTVANADSSGTQLYALNQSDGTTAWSQPISGTYFWSNAAYDAGRVFVVNTNGLLRAFEAGSGNLDWAVQMPGQYSFSGPPTASGGVVYLGGAGSGGTLYAVDETSGNVLATQFVANGDTSSPALSGASVFVSYACQQTYAFARTTLTPQWHYSTYCEGGGGKTPVYSAGRLFSRDPITGNVVFDAVSGANLRSFAASPAPATDGSLGWFLNNGVLEARDVDTGSLRWSFAGDGQLDSAPIAVKTVGGEFVFEGSGSGTLYALNAATGEVASTMAVGAPVPAPDEQNVSHPLTGLGAGQGTLVVPAGNVVTAYTGSTLSCPTNSIDANFNAQRIFSGRTIWFNSAFKAAGLGSTPVTVKLYNATVVFTANGSTYNVPVPDATIKFSPTAAGAATTYTPSGWQTTVPSKLSGDIFLSGVGFQVPNDLPKSIKPVTFGGSLTSDTPGIKVSWRWGAAVYNAFNSDPSQLGVKPVDSGSASVYTNGDHAGSPENYKQQLVAGGTGGGGSNYTGNQSASNTVMPCLG